MTLKETKNYKNELHDLPCCWFVEGEAQTLNLT